MIDARLCLLLAFEDAEVTVETLRLERIQIARKEGKRIAAHSAQFSSSERVPSTAGLRRRGDSLRAARRLCSTRTVEDRTRRSARLSAFAEATADRRTLGGGWSAERSARPPSKMANG